MVIASTVAGSVLRDHRSAGSGKGKNPRTRRARSWRPFGDFQIPSILVWPEASKGKEIERRSLFIAM